MIKALLKYGIGIGLLFYVIRQNWWPRGNNPGIQGLLQQTPDFLIWAALVGLSITCVSVQFLRWYILVRALDLPFTIRLAFRLGLVGCFWNAFAPGSVGGDLVKGYYIAHGQPGRRAAAVATVIADRLVGLFGLIWFSAVFGAAFWIMGNPQVAENDYLKNIIRVCGGLTIAAILGWIILGLFSPGFSNRFGSWLTGQPVFVLRAVAWVLRQPLPSKWGDRITQRLGKLSYKLGDVLAEMWYSVWTYRQRPGAIYKTILMTALVHMAFVLMFHLAVRVFPAPGPASFPEHLVATPIGYIAQAFFPVPGGVGGGEYIFGYLYTILGKPESTGVVGRLTMRLNEWAIGIVGLYFYLRMRTELHQVEEEVEEDKDKDITKEADQLALVSSNIEQAAGSAADVAGTHR